MAFGKRREVLRTILQGSTCVRPGSVYDATSVRIAEDLGFEVGMFGGSVASLAVLGDPDIALITLTELCEQMRRVPRGAGIGRCRGRWPDDRGYVAAAGLRAGEDATDFARGGRRQDEGCARWPQRSLAGHHRPHRRRIDHRSR